MSSVNARAIRAGSQPRALRRLRESVAGQRRRDHVERVFGPTAVVLGIGQPRDHVEELHDRARPPVGEEQRQRVGVRRARVHEVDLLPVDPGAEVRQLVEPRFLRAPVVLVAPVLDELAQVAHRDPVLPAGVVDLVREAGRGQTVGEVVEDQVADADLEGLNARTARSGPS